MSRWLICTATFALLTAACGQPSAHAQNLGPSELPLEANPLLPAGPSAIPMIAEATPATSNGSTVATDGVVSAPPAGYVRLNAPMYPSPKPNIPIWTGSTMITNQALAPHEMLYPHTYRAMFPPFYHRVRGCYHWTPFGYRSHENWDLLGTTVQVKYRSKWPAFGPHRPELSSWGGPWK
jgi:hypothetical protein